MNPGDKVIAIKDDFNKLEIGKRYTVVACYELNETIELQEVTKVSEPRLFFPKDWFIPVVPDWKKFMQDQP